MKARTCMVFILAGALFLGGASAHPAAASGAFAAAAPLWDCSTAAGISLADCQALVALYNGANGPNWTDHTNWLTDAPCSDWYGVTCDPDDRVITLALPANELNGTIPAQLGDLTSLQILDLSDNELSGTIPSHLGNLASLVWLKLGSNELSGSIPPQLGSLASLEWLELSYNNLGGSIPPELDGLAHLRWLNLYSNQLSGAIPVRLGNLAGLEQLVVGSNQLNGIPPAELGNLANLSVLLLSSNPLSGSLPRSLTKLSFATFWFDNTLLCEPGDSAFQTWLAGIGDLRRTGVICDTNSYTHSYYLPMIMRPR